MRYVYSRIVESAYGSVEYRSCKMKEIAYARDTSEWPNLGTSSLNVHQQSGLFSRPRRPSGAEENKDAVFLLTERRATRRIREETYSGYSFRQLQPQLHSNTYSRYLRVITVSRAHVDYHARERTVNSPLPSISQRRLRYRFHDCDRRKEGEKRGTFPCRDNRAPRAGETRIDATSGRQQDGTQLE